MGVVHILGADVGGTTTRIALARVGRVAGARPEPLVEARYASRDHAGLRDVVGAFVARPEVRAHAGGIAAACFAVAGPVDSGRAQLTNLPWRIDEEELQRELAFRQVRVVNDFAAAGLGIELLGEDDFLTLQAGARLEGAPRVVLGAGTGLGVAMLERVNGRYEVRASEAGHGDFAPVDALQDALLAYLRGELGRVSSERVVSGPGLPRILRFLADSGAGVPGSALKEALGHADPAEAITEFALTARDPLAEQALEVFVSAYGAFAGNMALIALARGGVFVAGGIAPKISTKLAGGGFMRAFTAKGRFRKLLETIPVQVVMNERVGLYGALAEAARAASETDRRPIGP